MIDKETYKLHRTIIYGVVIICQILGFFGNINLIVLTYRKSTLQSKYGLIFAFLALLHTLCLLYEYVDMGFSIAITFFPYRMHRDVCFYSTFPYIFLHSLQTGTICVLAFDLFIGIAFPLKHRIIDARIYLPVVFFFPFSYGIGTVVAGFIYVDEAIIQMCNPPSALFPSVNSNWYAFMLVFTVATVVLYLAAFGLLYWKKNHLSSEVEMVERKAMKTLQLLIVVFTFSRFITTFLFNILTFFHIDPDVIILVQNYNGIFAVITYTQNAYVCYIRSAEYRALFNEQLSILFGKLGLPCFKSWSSNNGIVKSGSRVSKIVHPQFREKLKESTVPVVLFK